MVKRSKNGLWGRLLAVIDDRLLLYRAWALVIIMITCLPPRCNWHTYCLLLGMPVLLISLALSIWQAIRVGTDFADNNSEPQNLQDL
jgi:hypothetical protein